MTETFHKEVQITATLGDLDFDDELETYQPPKYYYVKIKTGDRYLYYGADGAIVGPDVLIQPGTQLPLTIEKPSIPDHASLYL